jgi:hypothetical protein
MNATSKYNYIDKISKSLVTAFVHVNVFICCKHINIIYVPFTVTVFVHVSVHICCRHININAPFTVTQSFLNSSDLSDLGGRKSWGPPITSVMPEKIILCITIYSNIFIFMSVTNNIYQKHKISRIQCGYEFRRSLCPPNIFEWCLLF